MYVLINFLKDSEQELIVGIRFSSNLQQTKDHIDSFVESGKDSTDPEDEDIVEHTIRVYEVSEDFNMSFDSEMYQTYFCDSKVIYEGTSLQNGWC